MDPSQPVEEALLAAVAVLENRGVPYALMGGLAVNLWGRIRTTHDVDLAIIFQVAGLNELTDSFRTRGFLVPESGPIQLGDQTLLRLQWPARALTVDIHVDLLLAGSPFHEQCVRKAVELRLASRMIRVVRPEDLILLKLLAGRPLDLVDARDVARINCAALDTDYLRREARVLGLEPAMTGVLSS